jgi:urea transporter
LSGEAPALVGVQKYKPLKTEVMRSFFHTITELLFSPLVILFRIVLIISGIAWGILALFAFIPAGLALIIGSKLDGVKESIQEGLKRPVQIHFNSDLEE